MGRINSTLYELDEARRNGMVDLVKVILSISAVMLTIFAAFLPKEGLPSACEHPLVFAVYLIPALSLLVCISVCFFHLHYAQVGIYTDRLGKFREVLSNVDEISSIFPEIDRQKIDNPYLYKKSIPTIGVSFLVTVLLLCLHPFLNIP